MKRRRTDSAPLGAGSLLVVSISLCAALAGCSSPKVASANLDSLHESNGRYRYHARLLTPLRAFFGQFMLGAGLDPASMILRQKEVAVANPARKTLENVLIMSEGPDNASAKPGLRAERVRQFAYLACEDPSALVRERSLIELGMIAASAGLGEPVAAAGQAANAPELSEAIAGLAEVVRPMAKAKGGVTETQRVDLQAACDLLGEMEFDVAGAHRILAVTAALLDRRDAQETFGPVADLSTEVERGMIRQALARSLADEVPRTRAAAIEANWRAYGDVFLGEALRAVAGAPPAADALFQLAPVWAGDEEVFLVVFELIREHGLPVAPDDRVGRLEQLFTLCGVAIDYSLFSDRTRNAAMLALGEVSGSGIHSLRLEDWQNWWDEYGVREQAALRELEKERAEGPPEP